MDKSDKLFILTTENGDVSIFQNYISTKFKGSKKCFYKTWKCYMKYYVCTDLVFSMMKTLYNIAVFILVQSEEYSLIWKAKPNNSEWQR